MVKSVIPSKNLGFTLIEALCAIAIIGILASIAIPSYILFGYRAMQSEAVALTAEVADAELAFFLRPRLSAASAPLEPCVLTAYGGLPSFSTPGKAANWLSAAPDSFELNMVNVLGVSRSTSRYYVTASGTAAPNASCNTPTTACPAGAPSTEVGTISAMADLNGDFIFDAFAFLGSDSAYGAVMGAGGPKNGIIIRPLRLNGSGAPYASGLYVEQY